MKWWEEEVVRIEARKNSEGIVWFIDTGKLINKMVDQKVHRNIKFCGLAVSNKMAETGGGLTLRQVYRMPLFAKKFTPLIINEVIKLGMPVPLAEEAACWTQDRLEDALDVARKHGWKEVKLRFIDKARKPYALKKNKGVIRGNELAYERTQLVTFKIKEDFEWSVDGIALGYVSLESQVPKEVLDEARKVADERLSKLSADRKEIA